MKPCKRWDGAHNVRDGRAVNNAKRAPRPAARVIYEESHGPIPEGHQIHHTCHNKWCVEETHLVAVTRAEHDELHRRTHCPQGHPLEGDNLYVPPAHPNQRQCKTCRRDRNRIWMREYNKRRRCVGSGGFCPLECSVGGRKRPGV